MSSRSPVPSQRRVVYLNDETPHRDPTTIFHSPYTNGKKSKEYTNPTLISSAVFYDYKTNNIDFKSGQLDHFGRPKSPLKTQGDYQYRQFDERSNTPGRSITPDHSKTPRRKRQFDQTREYIKDHFSTGLHISAENKRPLKKYVNSNPNLDNLISKLNQTETVKYYLGQLQDRSFKKSNSHVNLDQLSQVSGNGGQSVNNVTAFNEKEGTPMRRNNSFILSRKKDDEEYNSQLQATYSTRKGNHYDTHQQQPQTPNRNRDLSGNGNGFERSMTPNTMQRYLNEQMQSTPQRKERRSDHSSNGGGYLETNPLTPKTLQKYKQSFTPLKECCHKCINEKMATDKKSKARELHELEHNEQALQSQKYTEEVARQKQLAKEKQLSTRKQYDQYIQAKKQEDKQKKQDQIQENIEYNERMNKLIEHEKQVELDKQKQQKIQKIKMYSQQLKQQIEQKETQRKHQILKEKQENDRNQQLQMRVQQERSQNSKKVITNMVEYREQLLNQQIQQDIAKNKQKKEESQMYKKIQDQVSKYSEQEKELLRQIKHQKKQEYENFMKQKEQIKFQNQEEKKKSDYEMRQKFQDIENEDYMKKVNTQRVANIQKQNFCNGLKDQIFEKERTQKQRKQEDLKKSQSTTLMLTPSHKQNQQQGLSPCYTCHKKVPKYEIGLYY